MKHTEKGPGVVTSAELQKRRRGFVAAEQLATERIHTGSIINLDRDRVRFPDGTEANFEIARHPGASAIVPFLNDPKGEEPQLLLIRQFRYASGGYLFEIPAGRLDEGETPAQCAARELKEETGCTAERIEPLTTILTTPGFTDEVIHLFMATGLTHGEAAREPDEFVEVVIMRLSEALERIAKGEITDAKTALALLYVAGFRTG